MKLTDNQVESISNVLIVCAVAFVIACGVVAYNIRMMNAPCVQAQPVEVVK